MSIYCKFDLIIRYLLHQIVTTTMKYLLLYDPFDSF